MFVPKRTLTQGVFPVAAQEGVATLLTTTPGEDNCYLNRVMERTDINGDPLLPVLRFGEPCSDCKLTTCPWKCKHNTGELPAWHSADKRGQMQFLVRAYFLSLRKLLTHCKKYENDLNDFLKETLAFSMSTKQYSFQPNDLREFRLLPHVQDPFIPDMLVLAADAAHGGDCDFAVSMGYIRDGNLVVRFFTSNHRHILLLLSPPPQEDCRLLGLRTSP